MVFQSSHRPLWRRPLFAVLTLTALIFLLLVLLEPWYARLKQSAFHDDTQNIVKTWVTSLQGEQKWVVLTQTLTHTVERRQKSYAWWVYLGETVVRLRVEDCKVQYFIPTDKLRVENLKQDAANHRYTLDLPRPILDETFVDIPSNPDKWSVYKANGWARFDKNDLENQVRRDVRSEILANARQSGFDRSAEQTAKDQIAETLRNILKDKSLAIDVIFH